MNTIQIDKDCKGLFSAFAVSRIGGRSENQDSYAYRQTRRGFVVTVCDGMGGGPGGKTASSIAVNEIIVGIEEAPDEETSTNVLIKAVRRANMAICMTGDEHPELKGMGSTATVLLINEESAYIAHVGDSRVYQLRCGTKVFRTFDHSMVFELVSQKVITEEQARLSAQSNVITRALGIRPDVEVDVSEVPFLKGDRFVLCTDGIHGTMPEKQLLKLLTKRRVPLMSLTDDVATYVDNLGRSTGGGHDNLTMCILEPRINSKLKIKMSKKTRITMASLAVALLVSLIFNVVQCSNRSIPSENKAVDTVQVSADTLKTDTLTTEK